jgi:hypothetical protein
MRGGEIFGNTTSGIYQVAGGVAILHGALRIVNGYIAGSDSQPEARRNTGVGSAALLVHDTLGTGGHGRFDGPGGAWQQVGSLSSRNAAVRVTDGELQ